ncbi:hypothetical protein ACFODL_15025 [Phenylobacterium terrae]|uniref:DUF4131 domain-containing protein n=1 Tax=Phenylobacterium terrae TaxID=2665495 RepID=A0ABW4N0I8_9CAUL
MTAYQRTKRMKGLSRTDQVWFGAWLLTGLALYVFQDEIIFGLFVLAIPIYLLHLFVGVGLLLVWATRPLRDHWAPFWPALMMLGAGGGLIAAAPDLGHGGAWIRFLLERPRYERIVAQANDHTLQGRDHEWGVEGEQSGVHFRSDFGPPVRVAFEWHNGIGDWVGLVWDPTDAVAGAGDWRGPDGRLRSHAPPRAASLFGGGLASCRPLRDHYYRCGFS